MPIFRTNYKSIVTDRVWIYNQDNYVEQKDRESNNKSMQEKFCFLKTKYVKVNQLSKGNLQYMMEQIICILV